jgi:hypothetical protein
MEETKEPSEQALLTEYHVCEQDNVANTQGFWTLSAIFIGLSSAFLAGLIYAVITNKSILNLIQSQSTIKSTLTIGIIAIIIGIANLVILKKLKEWQTRIQFNLGINNRRMREIDLILGTRKAWRIYAIDRWYEILKEKRWKDEKKNEQEKWDTLVTKFKDDIDPKYHKELHKLRVDTLELVEQYFKNGRPINRNGKFEIWMSKKHFPCILHTLMSLWVLVIAFAVCIMLVDNNHFNWGWSLFTIIVVICLSIIYFWNQLCRYIKQIFKKLYKELSFDP